ncbi:hypothetical protein KQI63_15640 [bacterium]|nr:hypothetical protein [bacterium]
MIRRDLAQDPRPWWRFLSEEVWPNIRLHRKLAELRDRFSDKGGSSEDLALHMGLTVQKLYPLCADAQAPRPDGWSGRVMMSVSHLAVSYLRTGDRAVIDAFLDAIGLMPSVPKPESGVADGSVLDELGGMVEELGRAIADANGVDTSMGLKRHQDRLCLIKELVARYEGELLAAGKRIEASR